MELLAGLADNSGRIPEAGFLEETRLLFGPAIASPIQTPGVSKDTECLTPATNPDLSLGTLTTRVEYQKPGFLKKLGFSFIGELTCVIKLL